MNEEKFFKSSALIKALLSPKWLKRKTRKPSTSLITSVENSAVTESTSTRRIKENFVKPKLINFSDISCYGEVEKEECSLSPSSVHVSIASPIKSVRFAKNRSICDSDKIKSSPDGTQSRIKVQSILKRNKTV